MKRWLKRTSAAIGLLLVLLLGGVAFLLSTETGLQLLWPRLAALAGPALTVESVSGRLGGALHLHGVDYRTDSDTLRADELWLDWNPRALLRGTLKIKRLGGRGVHYRHTPGAPAADETPLALPETIRLPVRIVLEELRVESASVTAALPRSRSRRIERFSSGCGPLKRRTTGIRPSTAAQKRSTALTVSAATAIPLIMLTTRASMSGRTDRAISKAVAIFSSSKFRLRSIIPATRMLRES